MLKKIKVRPRDQNLKEKWEGYNESVTPTENTHFVFSDPEDEDKFYSLQYDTKEKMERYKKYRSEWWERSKKYIHGNAPLAIIVELVSTCNLACTMCFTITDKFQNAITGATRMMPWEQFKSIIDEADKLGVYSVLLSWRGESSLYRVKDKNNNIKTFVDALKYARTKNFLEISSLTHGQLIDENVAEGIVDAAPNWISFSIDGLESAYNKIRTPPDKKKNDKDYNAFKIVTNNIRKLVEIRDKNKKSLPRIRTNSIFPAISDDPIKYKNFMKSIGVDLVTTSEVADWRKHRLDDNEINMNWSCSYPFQRLTVSANSIILPCPSADQEEENLVFGRYLGSKNKILRDYEGKQIKKEIPENSIESAWHSEKWNKLRDAHKNKKRHLIEPGCRNCFHGVKKKGVQNIPSEWDIENMEWKNHHTRVR